MPENPSVAFVVGGLYTEASGVGRILCGLANALERAGLAVPVYTARRRGHQPAAHLLARPERCIAEPAHWMGRLSWSPALRRRLDEELPALDVIHNHSMWMLPNAYGSHVARRHNKPVVFTAYGYLEPWALAHSGWKKQLAGRWFQDRDLRDAACIHVNSSREVESVRAYGLDNPIAVIPNGIDLPPEQSARDTSVFRTRFGIPADCPCVLFLSRLHAKKGLAHLIEAWRRLQTDFRDWHLVIAGPDDGFEAEARSRVEQAGLASSVTFTGLLTGETRQAALAAADVFVLPSYSEGFSSAVLEAMASRLPVLVTPGCNFPDVRTYGAGLETEPTVEGTTNGLRELMETPCAEREAMGLRGRELVERRYAWDRVVPPMLDLYRWLHRGGPPPETVQTP